MNRAITPRVNTTRRRLRGTNRPDHAARRGSPPRRGTILLLVVMCVLIAGVLMATVVRSTTLRRAQQRQQQFGWQASWLAESAGGRARARLAADPDYRSETWTIPADALGGRAAEVTISLAPDPLNDARWRITATAVFPAADGASPRARAQVTRVTTELKPGNEGELP